MDDLKTCNKCGKEFTAEELVNHDTICSYAFSNEDYMNLIPCEICNELISIEDYQRHATRCVSLPNIPAFFRGSSMLQPPPSNEVNIDSITEEINNDPIARALFRMILGNVPNQPNENINIHGAENNATTGNGESNVTNPDSVVNPDNVTNPANVAIIDEGNIDIGETIPNYPINGDNIINLLDNIIFNTPQINTLIPQNIPDLTFNIQNIQNILDVPIPNLNSYDELINLNDVEVGVSDIEQVSEMGFEEVECPICCGTCLLSRKTKCGHVFCDGCLSEWLNTSKKCPSCMIELE